MRRKWAMALLVGMLGSAASAQEWGDVIARWVSQDAASPPRPDSILVTGSSSVRRWLRLGQDFSDYDVIQRGFGGSTFFDLNAYVNQIVLPYDPAAIVVYEGSNDVVRGLSAAAVFNDYLTFVDRVHDGQSTSRPPIPIFFLSITPTPGDWPFWPVASQVNSLIESHTQTDPALFFIDVATPFLATGQPPASFLFDPDEIHLSQAGYDIWTSVIRASLTAAIPPSKRVPPNPSHPTRGRILLDVGATVAPDGAATTNPSLRGNWWNNWHSTDSAIPVLAGELLADLITTAGTPSGIDVLTTGGFQAYEGTDGSLLNPQPSLLGRMAVETATQDVWQAKGGNHPGGLMVRGLRPYSCYELRFFASFETTDTNTTRYQVSNGTTTRSVVLQVSGTNIGSGGQYDGNDDTIVSLDGLTPDPYGQLFVEVKPEDGIAHLGILEIIVRPGVSCTTEPHRMVAQLWPAPATAAATLPVGPRGRLDLEVSGPAHAAVLLQSGPAILASGQWTDAAGRARLSLTVPSVPSGGRANLRVLLRSEADGRLWATREVMVTIP